jgi:DNA-binding IclR family transcriptional regulator
LNGGFGEAITLYERVGHEAIPLETIESRHRVRLTHTRGQLLPWPATASSKVLLAYASREDQEEMLRLMAPVRYTVTTVKSVKALRRALAEIRRTGYAYSDQQREQGVRAIAAPVFSAGEGRYCITMSGPLFRFTDDKIPAMITQVRAAATAISNDLRRTEY